MTRYSVKNDWEILSTESLTDYEGCGVAEVSIYEGSVIDNKDQTTYENGAVQVKIRGRVNKTKTFIGETAHHKAERFIDDILWKEIRAA
jgi:negative regulator of sigma E activity